MSTTTGDQIDYTPSPSIAPKHNYSKRLTVVVALLLLSMVLNAASFFLTYERIQLENQRAVTYRQRIEEVLELTEQQREFISGVLDEYKDAAYDNDDIDRIAEQQLIASEYQLLLLQTIAIQNTQILELLGAAP